MDAKYIACDLLVPITFHTNMDKRLSNRWTHCKLATRMSRNFRNCCAIMSSNIDMRCGHSIEMTQCVRHVNGLSQKVSEGYNFYHDDHVGGYNFYAWSQVMTGSHQRDVTMCAACSRVVTKVRERWRHERDARGLRSDVHAMSPTRSDVHQRHVTMCVANVSPVWEYTKWSKTGYIGFHKKRAKMDDFASKNIKKGSKTPIDFQRNGHFRQNRRFFVLKNDAERQGNAKLCSQNRKK